MAGSREDLTREQQQSGGGGGGGGGGGRGMAPTRQRPASMYETPSLGYGAQNGQRKSAPVAPVRGAGPRKNSAELVSAVCWGDGKNTHIYFSKSPASDT